MNVDRLLYVAFALFVIGTVIWMFVVLPLWRLVVGRRFDRETRSIPRRETGDAGGGL